MYTGLMSPVHRPEDSRIGVWMDRDLDVGDGLAADICNIHFAMAEDGLACVTDRFGQVAGLALDGLVLVDSSQEDAVVEAADLQVAENIYLHYVKADDGSNITHVWDIEQSRWEPWQTQPTYPDIEVNRMVSSDIPEAWRTNTV